MSILFRSLLIGFSILFIRIHENYAQKYDQNWLFGYGSGTQGDLFNNHIDFSKSPVFVDMKKSTVQFLLSFDASFSDKNGNLLLYSDGCKIYDAQNNLIENGDNINAGVVADIYCANGEGYPSDQGGIVLPTPGKENEYDFITYLIESLDFYGGRSVKLLNHHIVDNKPGLKLTIKNSIILQDSFSNSDLMACKHANGRDWWILIPKMQSNTYFIILLDNNGFHNLGKQSLGPVYNYLSDWCGQAVFSPFGNKYARYDRGNDLTIYDFDRCNGTLSNPLHIEIHDQADTLYMGCSIAYSANSQFLYISSGLKIYQLDMNAPSIPESMITVANYDGFLDPFPTNFYLAQLAPDNKIYICSNNSVHSMHVIDSPDLPGLNCNVIQHGISLPYYIGAAIPFYPNYRLGPLKGSSCDTLTDIKNISKNGLLFTLFPNPAREFINLKLGVENKITNLDVQIIDVNYKTVFKQSVKNPQKLIQLKIDELISGIYFLLAYEKGELIYSNKFSKN